MLKECLLAEVSDGRSRNLWWAATKILLFSGSAKKAVLEYRLASWLSEKGHRRLSTLYFHRLESRYTFFIGKRAIIGPGLELPHPVGIVIGEGVIIGRNCTIFQQTTIGGKDVGDAEKSVYPSIGDDVVVFAGAKILGNIRVESGSVIGANSVVLKDVAENAVVAGAPATEIGNRE